MDQWVLTAFWMFVILVWKNCPICEETNDFVVIVVGGLNKVDFFSLSYNFDVPMQDSFCGSRLPISGSALFG